MAATLYLGDCINVMKTLPTGSVDAIVTDPPYGQTNEAYDSPIAFDPAVWRECYRVAADNASLVSFAGSPTYHRIASAIEAAGWRVRQMWGWVYRDGLITSAWPKEGFDRLAPAFDPIVYATKGKVLLNLEREGESWKCWSSRSGETYSVRSRSRNAPLMGKGHWPRTIVASDGIEGFQYFVLSRGQDRLGRTGHPNQKPLALVRWIVAKLPAQTILDPFMGSGTTGVACEAENRSFVGIEQAPVYHAIAAKRLTDLANNRPLFASEVAS